jgi:molybdopterin-guanine dinucleotide biosynthesis protein A
MLTGAILAGGENKRMGRKVKALLPFQDEPLILRQIQEMQKICDEVIVVTNDPSVFLPVLPKDIRMITDYIPGKGPLSGMHSAFSLASHDTVWVVACDMPMISAKTAERMVAKREELGCDAVIPVLDKQLHPLHGIYHKNCVDVISAFLHAKEYRLIEMIKLVYWMEAGELFFEEEGLDPRCVTNMNTPEDYEQALEALSSDRFTKL